MIDELGKTTILVFVRYYIPGYKSGGPLRTISNMVEALKDSFDFYIVTSDRDALDVVPYEFLHGKQNEWYQVGGAKVFYLNKSQQTINNYKQLIKKINFDFIYLNSFFDTNFSLKPLISYRFLNLPIERVVLAPRGEFSSGALQLKSTKKNIYIRLVRLLGLYKNLTWHASSDYEKQDVLSVFSSESKVKIALNLHDQSEYKPPAPIVKHTNQPLKIVFLSRIATKKNIKFIINILNNINKKILFDIYGPIREKQYWQQCLSLIDELPMNIRFKYKGTVNHAEVRDILSKYHLFFLPTLGENYGHVILEALSSGTPVLISDTTPWLDLEENNVGWALSLENEDSFKEKIEWLASATQEEQLAMYDACIAYAQKHLFNQADVEANKQLFQ